MTQTTATWTQRLTMGLMDTDKSHRQLTGRGKRIWNYRWSISPRTSRRTSWNWEIKRLATPTWKDCQKAVVDRSLGCRRSRVMVMRTRRLTAVMKQGISLCPVRQARCWARLPQLHRYQRLSRESRLIITNGNLYRRRRTHFSNTKCSDLASRRQEAQGPLRVLPNHQYLAIQIHRKSSATGVKIFKIPTKLNWNAKSPLITKRSVAHPQPRLPHPKWCRAYQTSLALIILSQFVTKTKVNTRARSSNLTRPARNRSPKAFITRESRAMLTLQCEVFKRTAACQRIL